MLPITRHVKDVILHAEAHLKNGKAFDLKTSLIHADNSIEIMLKGYLRFDKGQSPKKVEDKKYHELLNSCEDIELIKNSKKYFQAYHDLRNSVYHEGVLIPPKADVSAAIELSKTLFNQLYPETPLDEAKIEAPTKNSLTTIIQSRGQTGYLTEVSIIQSISTYLDTLGYLVSLEFPAKGLRADIVAIKGNDVIVCEVKGRPKGRPVGQQALAQLAFIMDAVEIEVRKKVTGWLITNSTFTDLLKRQAIRYEIRLIDGDELSKILGTVRATRDKSIKNEEDWSNVRDSISKELENNRRNLVGLFRSGGIDYLDHMYTVTTWNHYRSKIELIYPTIFSDFLEIYSNLEKLNEVIKMSVGTVDYSDPRFRPHKKLAFKTEEKIRALLKNLND